MNVEHYRPRNDFVLIEILDTGKEGSIAVPQFSAQGKRLIVAAIGPKVEDLSIGDEVFAIGQKGIDLVFLPSSNKFFLTKESNVIVVVKRESMEG